MKSNIPFIDVHTHHLLTIDGVINIYNIPGHFAEESDNVPVSVGLHPWLIKEMNVPVYMNTIRIFALEHNVLAVGECGMDKLIDVDLLMQESLFSKQLDIAEAVQKPVIIHCVKAFDDLIRIKKEMNISVPLIVHGYNNNEQIAKQLLQNGFYFSFGEALLIEDSNASKIIKMIPIEKLFLETDDSEIPIQDIYKKAAFDLEIDQAELKEKIYSNFKRVFPYEEYRMVVEN